MVPGTSMLCRARCSGAQVTMRSTMPRGRSKRQRATRTQLADAAQNHLLATMLPPNPHALRSNAARHLIATSQRHRRRLPALAGLLICRTCKRLIRPGVDARFRIRSGQRIMTCLECGSVRRWGVEGVPDDRRKRAKAALASDLPISIRIGRNGITEELVAELSTQVAARGLVKVKLNRGLADREERGVAFRDLATSSGTDLLVRAGMSRSMGRRDLHGTILKCNP